MFENYTKANGSKHFPKIVAGAWKFNAAPSPFMVTTAQLVETAKEMVNAKLSTGKFIHVFVRGTAKKELGICFMYELGPDEHKKHRDDLKRPYIDFFLRRHGAAYRGYDIGIGVDIVHLTN